MVFANIYIFILALVLAILEIQIEGQHGWARNLPTWRPKEPNWATKLYSKIMSGKEVTGYHLTMFSFVFLIFHLPYVFGLSMSLEHWLKTLSLLFIFMVLWDFLWFVLNPHYPLKQFKAEHLSFHHQKWFLGIPTDYWGGTIISLLVLIPITQSDPTVISWWVVNYTLFALQTLVITLFSLYVLKIDKWHTDKNSDRL